MFSFCPLSNSLQEFIFYNCPWSFFKMNITENRLVSGLDSNESIGSNLQKHYY